ncbi:MAG TPA: PrsW family glutamic-type intramembrane protease, partial [Anaerolineaceae bacterium]|nr:PrsW family glutamic-type intramembrane protease [Anaerolineaceae bacterium]
MSILQLVFSLFVFLFFLGSAVLTARIRVGLGPAMAPELQETMLWAYTVALFLLALVCLPSVISSMSALSGGDPPRWLSAPMPALNWLPVVLFVLTLVVRLFLLPEEPTQGFLPAGLTALAVVLPALWFLRLGAGSQWGKNPKRNSGLLTFSLSFTTYFILILEAVLFFAVVVGVLAALARNPQMMEALENLLPLLQGANLAPEELVELLAPLLSTPPIFISILLLVALVIPMIEEAFKTLGVWLLKGRGISPAEGFVAGMVSGAGFALVEGLLNSAAMASSTSTDWLGFVIGRLGGTLLHIFNGGLLGWAMANAWQGKKPAKVVGTYFLTVLLHGIWNGVAILELSPQVIVAGNLTYIFLAVYALILLMAFVLFSRKVERQAAGSTD